MWAAVVKKPRQTRIIMFTIFLHVKKKKKNPLRGFSLRRYAVTRYAVTRFTNNQNLEQGASFGIYLVRSSEIDIKW